MCSMKNRARPGIEWRRVWITAALLSPIRIACKPHRVETPWPRGVCHRAAHKLGGGAARRGAGQNDATHGLGCSTAATYNWGIRSLQSSKDEKMCMKRVNRLEKFMNSCEAAMRWSGCPASRMSMATLVSYAVSPANTITPP